MNSILYSITELFNKIKDTKTNLEIQSILNEIYDNIKNKSRLSIDMKDHVISNGEIVDVNKINNTFATINGEIGLLDKYINNISPIMYTDDINDLDVKLLEMEKTIITDMPITYLDPANPDIKSYSLTPKNIYSSKSENINIIGDSIVNCDIADSVSHNLTYTLKMKIPAKKKEKRILGIGRQLKKESGIVQEDPVNIFNINGTDLEIYRTNIIQTYIPGIDSFDYIDVPSNNTTYQYDITIEFAVNIRGITLYFSPYIHNIYLPNISADKYKLSYTELSTILTIFNINSTTINFIIADPLPTEYNIPFYGILQHVDVFNYLNNTKYTTTIFRDLPNLHTEIIIGGFNDDKLQ